MNEAVGQLLTFLRELPMSKKISMVVVVFLLMAGFATLFMLANKEDYHVLFNNVSTKDAGAIIEDLKTKNIPYKLEGNGSRILVPAKDVHELRLSLVSQGLPKEGNGPLALSCGRFVAQERLEGLKSSGTTSETGVSSVKGARHRSDSSSGYALCHLPCFKKTNNKAIHRNKVGTKVRQSFFDIVIIQ